MCCQDHENVEPFQVKKKKKQHILVLVHKLMDRSSKIIKFNFTHKCEKSSAINVKIH